MRQAITTRYLGPTNSKGSRVKAIARKRDPRNGYAEMSATINLNHALSVEQRHCAAAKACAEKYGWSGLWIGGGNLDEDGYVFVNIASPESWGAMASSGSLGIEGRDWFFVGTKDS